MRTSGTSVQIGETHLNNVRVGPALVWLIVLSVFEQHFVHICAGILEQLVSTVEDDEGDLAVTQHAQLIGFLHQAKLSLCKRHLERDRREEKRLDKSQAVLTALHKALAGGIKAEMDDSMCVCSARWCSKIFLTPGLS